MDMILTKNAANIEMKPYQWIWQGRIALGKVTLISGDPGLGKSQLTANMAATVTNSGTWPDSTSAPYGRVVILSAEDDASDTIVPRLAAAGADLSLVEINHGITKLEHENIVTGQVNLSTDLRAIADLINTYPDINMIIIDPISAYLGKVDDHRNGEVRSVMAKLSGLASDRNVAIVCITHNNKSNNQEALLRSIGSIGFVASARAAFCVVRDPDDQNKRLFLPTKNNIGNDTTGFSFTIEPHIFDSKGVETSRIVWNTEKVTSTANEVMSRSLNLDEKSALEEATDFLTDILKNSPKSVNEIEREAKSACISWATMRRAKIKIGAKAIKCGKDSGWFWELPK